MHYASDAHIASIIKLIRSLKSNYDDDLIDILTNPIEAGVFSSLANTNRNNHLQFFERLTSFMAENIPPPNTTAIASDGSPSLNQSKIF
jgi:hypothetical protein